MIDKRSNEIQWDLVPRQQDSFVRLMNTALNAYINLLRIPFSFYQMEVNGTRLRRSKQNNLLGKQHNRRLMLRPSKSDD